MKNQNFVTLQQFTLTVPNLPGKLGTITAAFAKGDVSISNLSTVPAGNHSFVSFTTTSPVKLVSGILDKVGFSYFVESVYSVILPNKPGTLNTLLRSIATAGYNINTVFATTIPDSDFVSVVIAPTKTSLGNPPKVLITDIIEKQVGRVLVA
jgi:hypothetical protein